MQFHNCFSLRKRNLSFGTSRFCFGFFICFSEKLMHFVVIWGNDDVMKTSRHSILRFIFKDISNTYFFLTSLHNSGISCNYLCSLIYGLLFWPCMDKSPLNESHILNDWAQIETGDARRCLNCFMFFDFAITMLLMGENYWFFSHTNKLCQP